MVKELGRSLSTSNLGERDENTYSYENAQGVVHPHLRPKRRRKQHVFQMGEVAVAEKLLEVAMTHSGMRCVFSIGVLAPVAEAVLYFVEQGNLFE